MEGKYAWNERSYQEAKNKCIRDIASGAVKASEYMQKYKEAVIAEDYELCKAITEVLSPLNYHTADTHKHIKELNRKK